MLPPVHRHHYCQAHIPLVQSHGMTPGSNKKQTNSTHTTHTQTHTHTFTKDIQTFTKDIQTFTKDIQEWLDKNGNKSAHVNHKQLDDPLPHTPSIIHITPNKIY